VSFHGLPWWNWALQTIGVCSSYLGAELNSRMDVRGFHIWMFSNLCLLILHAVSGLWVLCLLDLLYLRLNFRGISRWKAFTPKPVP